MLILPAIDIISGQAVRLLRGDFANMTVYDHDPAAVALRFRDSGAASVHIVDLEGARDGGTPNLDTVLSIKSVSGVFCEVGGGIRSMETVERYLGAGIDRVILGTAAFRDKAFLKAALAAYSSRIAVGVDIRDGYVAVSGWTERSNTLAIDFLSMLEDLGTDTVICTDISRDGAMRGTNLDLYAALASRLHLNLIASGGVSTLEDIKKLRAMGLHGAIIGKAYYTGSIDLRQAIDVAR